jgi:hypothetical protein
VSVCPCVSRLPPVSFYRYVLIIIEPFARASLRPYRD